VSSYRVALTASTEKELQRLPTKRSVAFTFIRTPRQLDTDRSLRD
jgi:hypothetical protein